MTTSAVPTEDTGAQVVIQRVLFTAPKVHVYQIPPLTSTKGYTASEWTADNNRRQIFTARLRILETAMAAADDDDGEDPVTTEIRLEDPGTGELFAAAPYVAESVVEQARDSARFFAVRVQGDAGRKAMLGLGFEDRSEAFDFGVCVQELRKVHRRRIDAAATGDLQGTTPETRDARAASSGTTDFSLKPGEMITLSLGERGIRRQHVSEDAASAPGADAGLWSIMPPPPYSERDSAQLPFLPPPPSAKNRRADKRRSQQDVAVKSAVGNQVDEDGDFGEFQ